MILKGRSRNNMKQRNRNKLLFYKIKKAEIVKAGK